MKPTVKKRGMMAYLMMILLGGCVVGGCGSTSDSGDTAYDSPEPSREQTGDAGDAGESVTVASAPVQSSAASSPAQSHTPASQNEDKGETETSTDATVATGKLPETITVHYEEGNAGGGPIVYVMWLENAARTFVQHLYVCKRLLDNSLTGVALPHWQLNKRKKSRVDGVSGATRHPQITVTRALPKEAGTQFTVYAELDHSWDSNDWFGDQPALVYAVDVDLTHLQAEYNLAPIGWSAEKESTVRSLPGATGFDTGNMSQEMRYITHSKSDDTFGDAKPDRAATEMVKKLTVSFK